MIHAYFFLYLTIKNTQKTANTFPATLQNIWTVLQSFFHVIISKIYTKTKQSPWHWYLQLADKLKVTFTKILLSSPVPDLHIFCYHGASLAHFLRFVFSSFWHFSGCFNSPLIIEIIPTSSRVCVLIIWVSASALITIVWPGSEIVVIQMLINSFLFRVMWSSQDSHFKSYLLKYDALLEIR